MLVWGWQAKLLGRVARNGLTRVLLEQRPEGGQRASHEDPREEYSRLGTACAKALWWGTGSHREEPV